jgi:peroxiredoxin
MKSQHLPPSAPFDWKILYDKFVAHLIATGVGQAAPKPNDVMPSFCLPNSKGLHVDLADRLSDGPVVLNFIRGGWCTYCRDELRAWHDAIPRLEAAGGQFIAVSGEVGGLAEETRCTLAPKSMMLCDIDHGLALSLGLAFPLSVQMHQAYTDHGLDLNSIYGDSGWLLPIPATFVIDRSGLIRFAHVDPDFRHRADPATVIAVVETLG